MKMLNAAFPLLAAYGAYGTGCAEHVGAGEIVGEIVGYDTSGAPLEIVGYDVTGAPLMRRRGGAPAQPAAAHPPAGSLHLRLEDRPPTQARKYPLGFKFLAIPALGSQNVTSRPQLDFRPDRIVIPTAVATNFDVDDIRVGAKSQFIQAGSVPAEVFTQQSFDTLLHMDTAKVGMDIVFSVTSTDAVNPEDFKAALIGPALQ
jgi:hypothetical protein